MGSVAELTLQRLEIPALLVRAAATEVSPVLDRALAPLDGEFSADRLLPFLEPLAARQPLDVTFLLVNPGSGDAPGVETSHSRVNADPGNPRLRLSTRVGLGNLDEQITREAAAASANLIVVGMAAPQRKFSGLVYQALRSSPVPVLVLPLG
jgi:nucleotide-binding universal stress UspA family protein